MPLSVGDKLGHHEILSLIGKGGMGEVYRALEYAHDKGILHRDGSGRGSGNRGVYGSRASEGQERGQARRYLELRRGAVRTAHRDVPTGIGAGVARRICCPARPLSELEI